MHDGAHAMEVWSESVSSSASDTQSASVRTKAGVRDACVLVVRFNLCGKAQTGARFDGVPEIVSKACGSRICGPHIRCALTVRALVLNGLVWSSGPIPLEPRIQSQVCKAYASAGHLHAVIDFQKFTVNHISCQSCRRDIWVVPRNVSAFNVVAGVSGRTLTVSVPDCMHSKYCTD